MLDWNNQLIRGTSLDTYGKLRTAKSAITLNRGLHSTSWMDSCTHHASHATNDIDWYDIVFHRIAAGYPRLWKRKWRTCSLTTFCIFVFDWILTFSISYDAYVLTLTDFIPPTCNLRPHLPPTDDRETRPMIIAVGRSFFRLESIVKYGPGKYNSWSYNLTSQRE